MDIGVIVVVASGGLTEIIRSQEFPRGYYRDEQGKELKSVVK